MNFYRVAMKVFKEHRNEFIKISLKREKLKILLQNKRFLKKEYEKEFCTKEEIEALRKDIREGIAKINKLIGGILKYDNSRKD